MSTTFAVHSSFLEIASKYDGFILDQYGVLHNGKHPLPGAIETLKELVKRNKKLVILSNASSPAKSALAKLQKLGFDPEWFQAGAVTSGEEASRFIRENHQTKRVIWLTYEGSKLAPPPLDFLESCGRVELATSIDDADLVIAHGGEIWYQGEQDQNVSLGNFFGTGSFDTLGPILKACHDRDLPMICANPDFVVGLADGSTGYMPGQIAKHYEELGGQVTSFGKPHAQHFQACLRKLELDGTKVAHVGDSLHHDIAGAVGAGVDSVFVTSGIHCQDLGVSFGELPSQAALEGLFQKEKTMPTHVIAKF